MINRIDHFNERAKVETQIIATRHGEKEFESLLGSEERASSLDQGDYFRVPLDTRSLDYQIFFDKGRKVDLPSESYTSHSTKQLNTQEVVKLILELPEYQEYLRRGRAT